jgi:hypothetical protein
MELSPSCVVASWAATHELPKLLWNWKLITMFKMVLHWSQSSAVHVHSGSSSSSIGDHAATRPTKQHCRIDNKQLDIKIECILYKNLGWHIHLFKRDFDVLIYNIMRWPRTRLNDYKDYNETWRMASSEILHRVALVRTDVSEEFNASFIRVTRIEQH